MDIIILQVIATILASLLLGAGFTSVIKLREIFSTLFGKPPRKPEKIEYSERLKRLMDHLVKVSAEMDGVLEELSQVTRDREQTIHKVESELLNLQSQEKEIKGRIQALESVPLPVAEHFANLTASSEKRSARRDYVLFAAGVVTSTVVAIALKFLGLA